MTNSKTTVSYNRVTSWKRRRAMRFTEPETTTGWRSRLLQVAQQGEHTPRSLPGDKTWRTTTKQNIINTKSTKALQLCKFKLIQSNMSKDRNLWRLLKEKKKEKWCHRKKPVAVAAGIKLLRPLVIERKEKKRKQKTAKNTRAWRRFQRRGTRDREDLGKPHKDAGCYKLTNN